MRKISVEDKKSWFLSKFFTLFLMLLNFVVKFLQLKSQWSRLYLNWTNIKENLDKLKQKIDRKVTDKEDKIET